MGVKVVDHEEAPLPRKNRKKNLKNMKQKTLSRHISIQWVIYPYTRYEETELAKRLEEGKK